MTENYSIPFDTFDKFNYIASENTLKNIETCAYLLGKFENNTETNKKSIVVTSMFIPRQEGNANGCWPLFESENDMSQLCDNNNLLTLGWIHTHPTQTLMLSSVDEHTHHAGQLLIKNYISFVVSPKYSFCAAFTLNATGLETIQKCNNANKNNKNIKLHHRHDDIQKYRYVNCSNIIKNQFQKIKIIDNRDSQCNIDNQSNISPLNNNKKTESSKPQTKIINNVNNNNNNSNLNNNNKNIEPNENQAPITPKSVKTKNKMFKIDASNSPLPEDNEEIKIYYKERINDEWKQIL